VLDTNAELLSSTSAKRAEEITQYEMIDKVKEKKRKMN
jgi:hypothetical protein